MARDRGRVSRGSCWEVLGDWQNLLQRLVHQLLLQLSPQRADRGRVHRGQCRLGVCSPAGTLALVLTAAVLDRPR